MSLASGAHPALARTDHRPWPLPAAPWTWRQTWRDLLFAHWPVPAASLRRLVPEPLVVQEFDGLSWVGVVPFRMTGVMKRPWPDLPLVSAFAELNVRLYVEFEGQAGVWFLSLDAASGLAAWAGRRWFHLPYHHASMSWQAQGEQVEYASQRPGASFAASYGPLSPPRAAAPGTLEHWLTERYCLFARAPDGSTWRCDVHHAPWPLQDARADIRTNTMLAAHAIDVGDVPPLLHFARRLDVVIWPPARVAPPGLRAT